MHKPYKEQSAAPVDERPLYYKELPKSNTAMKIRPDYKDAAAAEKTRRAEQPQTDINLRDTYERLNQKGGQSIGPKGGPILTRSAK